MPLMLAEVAESEADVICFQVRGCAVLVREVQLCWAVLCLGCDVLWREVLCCAGKGGTSKRKAGGWWERRFRGWPTPSSDHMSAGPIDHTCMSPSNLLLKPPPHSCPPIRLHAGAQQLPADRAPLEHTRMSPSSLLLILALSYDCMQELNHFQQLHDQLAPLGYVGTFLAKQAGLTTAPPTAVYLVLMCCWWALPSCCCQLPSALRSTKCQERRAESTRAQRAQLLSPPRLSQAPAHQPCSLLCRRSLLERR
jgi:hypothetical protein